MQKGMMRRGFTLVEILVALIILSIITAFVVPDVINRADDADAPRLLADVMDLGTAVELFKLDLKTTYPHDIEDLAGTISSPADSTIKFALYGTNDIAKWAGPYIKSAITDGGTLPTGYDGTINDNFVLIPGGGENGAINYGIHSSDCIAANFISIVITGLSVSNFEDANNLVDGLNDGTGDGTGAGKSQQVGKLRLEQFASSGIDSTFYLMTPCH